MRVLKILAVALLLTVMINCISAYQLKMTVRNCTFSYNDKDFNAWNEQEHKGIFLTIINDNLNLGDNENANYRYISYQPERVYFNNFDAPGTKGNSTIPMLNVKIEQENIIYTKCNFKVGNYKIFIESMRPIFAQSVGGGLTLTYDFNLTQGIANQTTVGYGDSSTGNKYNDKSSNYSEDGVFKKGEDSIYYADNRINSGYSSIGGGIVYSEGFYPYTNPVVITSFNLTQFPSGILHSFSLIRENAGYNLFDGFINLFYINSTLHNAGDYLFPTVTYYSHTNKRTGNTSVGNCNPKCLDVQTEDEINYTITIKNNFNYPIGGIILGESFKSNAWTGGTAHPTTDVSSFLRNIDTPLNIEALEEINITNNITIPMGVVLPKLEHWLVFTKNVDGERTDSMIIFPIIGSDSIKYLGINRFDTRIEMQKINGIYKPFFNMNVDLYVVDNYAYNYSILPGEYKLKLELFNGSASGIPKESFYFDLDANAFQSIEKTELTWGSNTPYSMLIPIKEEYAQEAAGGVKYNVFVYTIYNNETDGTGLYDKKIASNILIPYFKPGDIAYQLDKILNFGSDSRLDIEKIIVFNPSFYENDINLGVGSWSDETNFTISWDGINFGKYPTKTIHLLPLETKEIIFYVNATYNPWVSSSLQESLKINVGSLLETDEGKVEKLSTLDFILNVSDLPLNWFDLVPTGFSPDYIFLKGAETKNENIIVKWVAGGGISGFNINKNRNYTVNVSLINEDTGAILKEAGGIFKISGNWKEENIVINYDFPIGEYLVNLSLDSNYNISESDSSGGSNGEENNIQLYEFTVFGGCYYNTTDNYLYHYNSFLNWVKDDDCTCKCPTDLICSKEPGSKGHCGSLNNLEYCHSLEFNICNNITAHLASFSFCAWECTNGNCPPNPNIDVGECKACEEIFDGCGGYNNNVTCEEDPCYKAETVDCEPLNCNPNEEHYCYWDYNNDENKCKFHGNISGNLCNYSINILSGCTEGKDIMIINYTGFPTANCPSKLIKYPCYGGIKLTFFTIASLIIAIAVVVIVYFLIIKERKKRKRTKT